MWVVVEKDYYGEMVDIYGPFQTEMAAEQWVTDMGMLVYRVEVVNLTNPRSKKR